MTLLLATAAMGARPTCGPAGYNEAHLSPTGDWDDIYGQSAAVVLVDHKGMYNQIYVCLDVDGSLSAPNDSSDRFQIKVSPSPYYGEVALTQIWFDEVFARHAGTFLSIASIDAPSVPLLSVPSGPASPKFSLGYGIYVVTVQTEQQQPLEYQIQFLVEQVPEPATYALWLGGLGLVAGIACRRRSRQRDAVIRSWSTA